MNNEYDIKKSFQRIEETLIKSMKRNLTRHLSEEKDLDMNWSAWQIEQIKSLEQFKQKNKEIFKDDFSTINSEIEELIKKFYEDGKLKQEKTILQSIQNGNFKSNNEEIDKLWRIYNRTKNNRIKKKQLARIYKKVNQAEANFFKINERKLNALINETTNNFEKAQTSILRYANDQYRQIIYNAQVYANTGSGTVKQAIDMATKDFLSKGINNIEYANGAMVNIASYAEMAIRTANKRAYLQGEGVKRQEWGIHTVLVPNRGGGCPYCIKFQGRVFIDDVWSGGTVEESKKTGYPLLSSAIKEKLFHPNCKDTVVTYYPGISNEPIPPTKEELEVKKKNYINEQKQRYNERQIRKYKRLELGSVDSANIEKYHNKRLQWQKYNKDFCEKHNLKRQYDREDIKGITNIENNSNELSIPNLIKKTAKQQNQIISEKAKDFIDRNITSSDLVEDKLLKAPFAYRKSLDKIIIDSAHKDIKYYNVEESIIHEIVHLKDVRNKITEENFDALNNMMYKSKMYIDNNYNYFYNYLQKNNNNMALCDIMSALSNGKLSGDFGHLPEYWKNDMIVLNELSANLISSEIIDNNSVKELMEEIPPLKRLKEECIRLWQV